MNAAAISHMDSFGYAGMKMAPGKVASWVVARFDASGLYFLGTVPGDKFYSGAISQSGDYYMLSNDGALLVIRDPSQLVHSTNDASALQQLQADSYSVTMACGDIIVVNADIGHGMHTVVIGIEGTSAGPVIDMYDVDAQQMVQLTPDLPNDPSWGSGWMFAGGAYFASNAGSGVYQLGLRSIDPLNMTIKTRAVGTSEATGGNDGMNCANGYSPFPGCEHFCIDVGCPCMVGVNERCALGSCEQCPFCF
jgi:hypothetical protein